MSLKLKLITAFLIIILIPTMLLAASTGAIYYHQANSFQEDYGLDSDSFKVLTSSIQLLNRATRGVYNEIKLSALKDPERLESLEYIDSLNSRLKLKYSFILVRKDDKFIYSGNDGLASKVEGSLPAFGIYSTEIDGGIYLGGDLSFLVKQQDFYYRDGSEGTIFVITDVDIIVPQIKLTLIQLVISIISILCITAVVLMLWIYQSIIKPLNKLRRATYELKEGNLNYEIKDMGDDEIGQLCSDFEEMRIRLKQLIEAKLRNEKEQKELFSNISHDLKTPLTAIKGYAEGILDGVTDTPMKQEKYLKIICKKASDMTVLVDELSYYSKIDADTIPYVFNSIDISDYFMDCLDEYSLDAQIKNINIDYSNTLEKGVHVIADAEQLKRVVNNIIGNSVKYMNKEKGELGIRISKQTEDVVVEISDNGEGIDEKDLPNIFHRFYRADASRNSKKGGSGLGLAIAKKIIEDHGGRIWARSTVGVGTTIGFTLKTVKEDSNE